MAVLEDPRTDSRRQSWMDLPDGAATPISLWKLRRAHPPVGVPRGRAVKRSLRSSVRRTSGQAWGPASLRGKTAATLRQTRTSLIELDLLREGRPVIGCRAHPDDDAFESPAGLYSVAVNICVDIAVRQCVTSCSPYTAQEPLPCIHVPLRKDEAEVPLDLQFVFQQVYR